MKLLVISVALLLPLTVLGSTTVKRGPGGTGGGDPVGESSVCTDGQVPTAASGSYICGTPLGGGDMLQSVYGGSGAAIVATADEALTLAGADEVWINSFATGSSTHGLQEAITYVCNSATTPAQAAVIRIPGDVYAMGAATITVPLNCGGLIIQGSGAPAIVSGSTPSSGTLLTFDHAGGARTSFQVGVSTFRVQLRDFAIRTDSPQPDSKAIDVALGSIQFTASGLYIYAGSVTTNGYGIVVNDGNSAVLSKLTVLHHNQGAVRITGGLGSEGTWIEGSVLRSIGSTVGRALVIDGFDACRNVHVTGSFLQARDFAVDATMTDCVLTLAQNHLEAFNATGSKVIRASGGRVVAVGNYVNPFVGQSFFQRTAQTEAWTDVFVANDHVGPIEMLAGACEVYGQTRDADVSACTSGGGGAALAADGEIDAAKAVNAADPRVPTVVSATAATPSTIVARDASADTAVRDLTARNITADDVTVTDPGDGLRGRELLDNATACPNPASGSTVLCTVGGNLLVRDTDGASVAVLTEVPPSGVTPGSVGDADNVPVLTIAADGRITAASTVPAVAATIRECESFRDENPTVSGATFEKPFARTGAVSWTTVSLHCIVEGTGSVTGSMGSFAPPSTQTAFASTVTEPCTDAGTTKTVTGSTIAAGRWLTTFLTNVTAPVTSVTWTVCYDRPAVSP